VTFPGGTEPGDPVPAFRWENRQEAAVYVSAAGSYIALGVVLQSVVLNWIVGPLYFVCFVWAASSLLGRRGRRPS
jgi:hypothetical protein